MLQQELQGVINIMNQCYSRQSIDQLAIPLLTLEIESSNEDLMEQQD